MEEVVVAKSMVLFQFLTVGSGNNQEYSMDNRDADINLNPRFPYTTRACEPFDCDVASNALLRANGSLAETGKVFLREGNVSVCVDLMQFKVSHLDSQGKRRKCVTECKEVGEREWGGERERDGATGDNVTEKRNGDTVLWIVRRMQGQYLKDSRVSKLREAKCAVGAVREQKTDCRLWQN
jgi:hypothetical protein